MSDILKGHCVHSHNLEAEFCMMQLYFPWCDAYRLCKNVIFSSVETVRVEIGQSAELAQVKYLLPFWHEALHSQFDALPVLTTVHYFEPKEKRKIAPPLPRK